MDHRSRTALLDLLSIPVIYDHVCSYLSTAGLLAIAGTSKTYRDLIFKSTCSFRFLDLSTVKGAVVNIAPIDRGGELWRNERMDEGVTEEDFYSGPLRGIFSFLRRKNVLDNVRTLVLDNQTAPAEVLHDVICSGSYQIQILSLLGAKNLNEIKLRKSLQYSLRPTRPEGTPKLKALYIFGATRYSADPALPTGITTSIGAQLGQSFQGSQVKTSSVNPWYDVPGAVIADSKHLDAWAHTIHTCEGFIYFDAVLCKGPKHYVDILLSNPVGDEKERRAYINPTIASVTLPKGCFDCHTLPEGPAYTKDAPSVRLPLLSPPPLYTTSMVHAQRPGGNHQALYARCTDCLKSRCCQGCFKFWCEDCHNGEPRGRGENSPDRGTKRDCYDCGPLCIDCTSKAERNCQQCRGQFCYKHAHGSTPSTCDWCRSTRGRRQADY